MKKIWSLVLVAGLFTACGPAAQNETQEVPQPPTEKEVAEHDKKVYPYHAGAEFDVATAVSMADLKSQMNTFEGDSMPAIVNASINSVCKKKGCWMKLDMGDGENMMVRFKDYEFFVPTDAEEHKATINGLVFRDTIPVKELQHYAEDAGVSADSIAKITEPEIVLAFEATGVYVNE